MKLIYARAGLARNGAALIESAAVEPDGQGGRAASLEATQHLGAPDSLFTTCLDPAALAFRYRDCLHRLGMRERYPAPDWSIADRWIARELLATGMHPVIVGAVLRHGSPGFPRRHADPEDYLRRALRSASVFFLRAPLSLPRLILPPRALCESCSCTRGVEYTVLPTHVSILSQRLAPYTTNSARHRLSRIW